jgi:aryl-alcohol dehydrogenase-like predicted oxidoreductase
MQQRSLFFVDTAEVYGSGESERIICSLREGSPDEFKAKLIIATKFIPIPWPPSRIFMPSGMAKYCKLSLKRLGVQQVDLYQVHGPVHVFNSIDSIAGGLAHCVETGLAKAVGVSNYSLEEMINMDEALKKRGLRLASNQVEFSLLRTLPETSGLLEECKKRGILMMAYSPL